MEPLHLNSSPEHHPTLPYYSTAITTQNDNLATPKDSLVDNKPVNDDTTDSPIKVYSKTDYPLFRHLFKPKSFCFQLYYETLAS